MIGHVFESSGATCLAMAPHPTYADTYIVLAEYQGQYAVAHVLIADMPQPTHWVNGDYHHLLPTAVEEFRTRAQLGMELSLLEAQVDVARTAVAAKKMPAGH